jgi:hypothetical protein
MFSTPPEQEPVAFHYLAQLDARLRSRLETDLDERLAAAALLANEQDSSPQTTARRVSWCCYYAGDLLVARAGSACSPVACSQRPLITLAQLDAMDAAAGFVEEAVTVDSVEFTMGTGRTGSGQVWQDDLRKTTHLVAHFREMLGYAKTYTQGIRTAAGTVGGTFFYYMVEQRTLDELMALAEELLQVTA